MCVCHTDVTLLLFYFKHETFDLIFQLTSRVSCLNFIPPIVNI